MTEAIPARNVWVQIILGVLAIGVVTFVCYPLHLDLTIPMLLFLLVVVVQSLSGGFFPTAVTSLVAAGCLDYFFVPPLLHWDIDNPLDGVALLVYLATSLIITRLASKARTEARTADAKRRDLARLYDTACRMMAIEPEAASPQKSLRVFLEVFEIKAICLVCASTTQSEVCGEPVPGLVEKTREAVLLGRDAEDAEVDISVRLMTVAGKTMGAVGFKGLASAEPVSGHLAMLAAAMIERSRSFQAASAASAATQAEVLRTAIVDAFAHQFNTPLAAILTAAGGIQEAGPLSPGQLEMAGMIESEAVRLGRLTTRLLHTARLNQDEVQPRMEPTDLTALITHMARQCRADGQSLSLVLSERPAQVASDRELLAVALAQLLDNAFKYAAPGGSVRVHLEADEVTASIRVSNQGSCIAPDEHERIFDRFYRGVACRTAPGTGLGLYVARKILMAHSGILYLVDDGRTSNTTTFCVNLPILKTETRHALKAS
jgi:two-component system, OmpR family, sensor histidine kinase KdpD